MSRSIKKGPYVEGALMKRIKEMNDSGKKAVVKTWSRSSTIFPEFVGHTVAVHDGRKHVRRKTWLDTNWASSPRPGPSGATQATRTATGNKREE